MSDQYGFTTFHSDNYFQRVVNEAAPETNILLIEEKDTVENLISFNVIIRRPFFEMVAHFYPELAIGGVSLGEMLMAYNSGKTLVEVGENGKGVIKELDSKEEDVVVHGSVRIDPSVYDVSAIRRNFEECIQRIEKHHTKAENNLMGMAVRLANLIMDKTIRVTVNSY